MAIEQPEPRTIERPYGWVVAAASMAMMAVGAGATYLVIVALKPIALEFGWPRAVPSLCYSFALLGAGLGGLFWGSISDRIGMVRPALLGGCGVALGAWLTSVADDVLTLYVAHGLFIGLLGNGVFVAPLLANITRWFDRHLGMAVAVVATGQSMAGAVWPPVLRYLTDTYGWRQACFAYAVVALGMLLPLSLVLRAAAARHSRSRRVVERARQRAGARVARRRGRRDAVPRHRRLLRRHGDADGPPHRLRHGSRPPHSPRRRDARACCSPARWSAAWCSGRSRIASAACGRC